MPLFSPTPGHTSRFSKDLLSWLPTPFPSPERESGTKHSQAATESHPCLPPQLCSSPQCHSTGTAPDWNLSMVFPFAKAHGGSLCPCSPKLWWHLGCFLGFPACPCTTTHTLPSGHTEFLAAPEQEASVCDALYLLLCPRHPAQSCPSLLSTLCPAAHLLTCPSLHPEAPQGLASSFESFNNCLFKE